MSRCSVKTDEGFTLLEVLIAVAILGITFVWLISATNQAIDMATRSKFITTSTLLAQKRIADVLSDKTTRAQGTGQGDFGEDYQGYTYDETVEETQLQGFYRYRLTVRWGEKNGLENVFTTFITPRQ